MSVPLPVLAGSPPSPLEPSPQVDRPHSPRSRYVHFFSTEHGGHVLVADGSRLYDLSAMAQARMEAALSTGEEAVAMELAALGLAGGARPYVDDDPPEEPPLTALSLAVSQSCNLGCTYCYAQGGSFGRSPTAMPLDVALKAVDRLLDEAPPNGRAHLSFLGGEPLVARPVLRQATEAAAREAAKRGIRIGFSITTNGTLLTPADAEFFERHGFAVTISLDGVGAVHDRLRPFKGGAGSYARVVDRLGPMLAARRSMQVSARVTVTPKNLDLPATLEALLDLGFDSVGFSPLLAAPTGRDEMSARDLERMLEGMIACGRRAERELVARRPYPFSNLTNALEQIDRGTHRPYPCGAGSGYFGVSAEGGLYACHRFVEGPEGALGDLATGVDRDRQKTWLADRHLHRQEPCHSCWARYLCGGGCHHEVIHRGRPACDYIRGWLHYCLGAYVRVSEANPDLFARGRAEGLAADRVLE